MGMLAIVRIAQDVPHGVSDHLRGALVCGHDPGHPQCSAAIGIPGLVAARQGVAARLTHARARTGRNARSPGARRTHHYAGPPMSSVEPVLRDIGDAAEISGARAEVRRAALDLDPEVAGRAR